MCRWSVLPSTNGKKIKNATVRLWIFILRRCLRNMWAVVCLDLESSGRGSCREARVKEITTGHCTASGCWFDLGAPWVCCRFSCFRLFMMRFCALVSEAFKIKKAVKLSRDQFARLSCTYLLLACRADDVNCSSEWGVRILLLLLWCDKFLIWGHWKGKGVSWRVQ